LLLPFVFNMIFIKSAKLAKKTRMEGWNEL
jgi:hypothetical protein